MLRKPALLTGEHRLEPFDCGEPVMNLFLHDVALMNQRESHSRTFVIADKDFTVIAYYALSAAMISRTQAPRNVAGHGAPREIPVALLARLAVDRQYQGQGLAVQLLKHAFLAVAAASQTVAFRAVMVHALNDEAERFYRKYHFQPAKGLERTLLLPMSQILASLARNDAI